ncbi:GntR family transcriptional regulator [Streptomyces sp. TRM66268-LWL]|uniref:GntR family transcriptional regulator n=1 Tax=Streptomyces polyasparticus TaxID=2767826 RepID=A0ABR7SU65_9ACTN|nr:GntR family transcriptional regulator [Streptomyces polyasparticus]MBC9719032.1 GntR family transcriptional regulator [Streptomyces polyasparticus]
MPPDPTFHPVSADGAQPPYVQAEQALAHAIATGALTPGQRLPSERHLCEQLGISRVTLRRALQSLGEQGLVVSSERRGWRVRQVGFTHSAGAATQAGFAEINRALGRAVTARVLLARTRRATADEAERLRLPAPSRVFELHRIRYLDGLAVCIAQDLVPSALAPALADEDFTTASLFAQLAARGHTVATASCVARAALATPRQRGLLDLDSRRAAPVLNVRRLSYDAEGTVVAASEELYRADRYELRITLG